MNDFAHWSIGCKPSLPRSCSCWQLLADPNLVRTFAWGTFVCTTSWCRHLPPNAWTLSQCRHLFAWTLSWCGNLPGGQLPGPHFKADICLKHILARHLPRPHFSGNICLDPAFVWTFVWAPFQCRHLPGGYLAWTTSWCGHLSGGHLLGPSWCGHLPGPKPGADIYLLDICLDPLGEDICLDQILVRTFVHPGICPQASMHLSFGAIVCQSFLVIRPY